MFRKQITTQLGRSKLAVQIYRDKWLIAIFPLAFGIAATVARIASRIPVVKLGNSDYGYVPKMVGWLNWKQDAAILLSWVIVTVWIAVKHPACQRAFRIYKFSSEQVKNPVKIGPEKVTFRKRGF